MATHFGNMNGISMTRVPCPATLDLKKKVDILSSLNAKCIIHNNRKYQSKLISNFSEEK
ncbi:unnamed protein product [Musa acuminata subsp. burmannicoides]